LIKTPLSTTEHQTRGQLRTEPLKSLGHLDPPTIPAGTALDEALRQMQANDGEPLLVTDGERLVGVLTERDVLMKILGRDVDPAATVDDFMSRGPQTLTLDSTVGEALHLMESGGFRTIPLIDGDGAVEGLLRQQDILEYVAEAFPQEILNLPPRPHQVMETEEGG
jgi:CBS domain-containing protein